MRVLSLGELYQITDMLNVREIDKKFFIVTDVYTHDTGASSSSEIEENRNGRKK